MRFNCSFASLIYLSILLLEICSMVLAVISYCVEVDYNMAERISMICDS